MAKQFFSWLIASFVLANFIADNILVSAATAVKGTKTKSKHNVTSNRDTKSLKSANLTTEEEIVALQKLIDEVKDTKASENTETDKTVANRVGQGNDIGLGENVVDADSGTTNSKGQKNRRRRRNKLRAQRRTAYQELNTVENLQERESSNVGEDERAELIDTTISQVPEESEVATTSEKSSTSTDNGRIGNRWQQIRNQRGRNGNGRRRGNADKDSKSRIASRPSGKAGAKGTPNKFKLNGFRIPKNKVGKAANRVALNSRNGRIRF